MNEDIFETQPTIKKSKLNILPPNPEKEREIGVVKSGRFPSWLHRKMHVGYELQDTALLLNKNRLHTVCEEAKCPNLLECWSQKTATFLVMGKSCTRNCGFCDIDFSRAPLALDNDEPQRVADSCRELKLEHVVITMVARDDLNDGGASHLVSIMKAIRKECPHVTLELLTSDFMGNFESLDLILNEKPDIFNHNVETVRSLSAKVRHKATYDRSLSLLHYVATKAPHIKVKSGIMVGLGESQEEVEETLKDLKEAGCSIVTMGQYLQPSRKKLLVKEFVTPEQFKKYEMTGKNLGIKHMFCGPFVRSSYHAKEFSK